MRVIFERFDIETNEKISYPAIIESKQRISRYKLYAFRVWSEGKISVMWQSDVENMMGRQLTDKQMRSIPTTTYIFGG